MDVFVHVLNHGACKSDERPLTTDDGKSDVSMSVSVQRHLCTGLLTGLFVHSIWAASDMPTQAMDGHHMHTSPASSSPLPGLPAQESAASAPDDLRRAMARVKAEYLFRFLGYVDFPRTALPQADTPMVIGVVGADEVFEALADTLPMRTVGTRQVQRRRMQAGDSLAGVHLLFAGRNVDLLHEPLVQGARSAHVLLVTEAPNGLGAGAIFNFLLLGDQLRFEASLEAAHRASLQVSSRVLVLAERVVGVR